MALTLFRFLYAMNNPFGFMSLIGLDLDRYVRICFHRHLISATLWWETFVVIMLWFKRQLWEV